jgi:hypothetical protein
MPRPNPLILSVLLLMALSILGGRHAEAFSIGSDISTVITPSPDADGVFVGPVSTTSCVPGFGCGKTATAQDPGFTSHTVTSRYAVRGPTGSTIPALFRWSIGASSSSEYLLSFSATDLHDRPLGSLFLAASTGPFFEFGVASCGPILGSCRFGGLSEFPTNLTATPVVGEFPFHLPVGPDTGIRAHITGAQNIHILGYERCLFNPEDPFCSPLTLNLRATFTLVPLPPAGATFLEPVPEPATLLLVGTTAAGLGLARWLKRRRSHDHAA